MQLPISFSRKDLDLKERTVQAINDLETEIKAIHSLRNRLQTNVNESLLQAMKSDNKDMATRYIEEYNDLVHLLDIVKSAEILLQNLSVKIDSTRYLQELVTILESAMSSVRVIKSDISRMVPAVDSTLDRISNAILEIKDALKINTSNETKECELPLMQVGTELPVATQPRTSILVQ